MENFDEKLSRRLIETLKEEIIKKAQETAYQQPFKTLSKEVIDFSRVLIDKEHLINAIALGIKIGWFYPKS